MNNPTTNKLTDRELSLMNDDDLIKRFAEDDVVDYYRTFPRSIAERVARECATRYAHQHSELIIRGNLLNHVVELAQAYGFEQNGWHDSIRYVGLKLGLLHRILTFAARSLKEDEELR